MNEWKSITMQTVTLKMHSLGSVRPLSWGLSNTHSPTPAASHNQAASFSVPGARTGPQYPAARGHREGGRHMPPSLKPPPRGPPSLAGVKMTLRRGSTRGRWPRRPVEEMWVPESLWGGGALRQDPPQWAGITAQWEAREISGFSCFWLSHR